jgi:hypothetical protein
VVIKRLVVNIHMSQSELVKLINCTHPKEIIINAYIDFNPSFFHSVNHEILN